jgi:coenzyme F420-reducing hydrogenase gamma subunit
LKGNPPEKSQNPVCVTCKYNENDCLLKNGILCLGPVTADGCGSLCINHNLPCVGCWGPLDVANRTAEFYLLKEKGYEIEEIKKKMANYSGTKIVDFFKKLGREKK